MPASPRAAAAALLLLACAGDADDSAALCDASGATAGQLTGTLDGQPWAVDAAWAWSGESLQVTTTTAEGWRVTLVAHRDRSGAGLLELAEAGAADVQVDLSADDGWALLYPEAGGTSLSSKEGGGALTLTTLGGADGGGAVTGCLAFEAAPAAGGESVVLEGGLLSATGS